MGTLVSSQPISCHLISGRDQSVQVPEPFNLQVLLSVGGICAAVRVFFEAILFTCIFSRMLRCELLLTNLRCSYELVSHHTPRSPSYAASKTSEVFQHPLLRITRSLSTESGTGHGICLDREPIHQPRPRIFAFVAAATFIACRPHQVTNLAVHSEPNWHGKTFGQARPKG